MPKQFSDAKVTELFKNYESTTSPIADIKEFKEDVMRFTYVFRILKRYKETGRLNFRLLLNHIVILYNVFGNTTTKDLIDHCCDETREDILAVLKFMERVDEENYSRETYDLIKTLVKEHGE